MIFKFCSVSINFQKELTQKKLSYTYQMSIETVVIHYSFKILKQLLCNDFRLF
jgi:hypothetical protein